MQDELLPPFRPWKKWRELGLGLKSCSATQQSFCKWTFVDVLRLCRSFLNFLFFCLFVCFFLWFIFERFERHFCELPPLLGARPGTYHQVAEAP
jgi:hypothetical protein